jgi:hypothetical protein
MEHKYSRVGCSSTPGWTTRGSRLGSRSRAWCSAVIRRSDAATSSTSSTPGDKIPATPSSSPVLVSSPFTRHPNDCPSDNACCASRAGVRLCGGPESVPRHQVPHVLLPNRSATHVHRCQCHQSRPRALHRCYPRRLHVRQRLVSEMHVWGPRTITAHIRTQVE